MSNDKLAALLSVISSVVVLSATFAQWWDTLYDGRMVLKPWIKIIILLLIVIQIYSLFLIFS